MNTTFSNCQGLKGSLVVRRLSGIKATLPPDILFLVLFQLGYKYVRCVIAKGIGGGLAFFWNKNIEVSFIYVDRRLIERQKITN